MRDKKNLRRISILVTAQTAYNLNDLAAMCGYREPGHVVDKLVREKMMKLNGGVQSEKEKKAILGNRAHQAKGERGHSARRPERMGNDGGNRRERE